MESLFGESPGFTGLTFKLPREIQAQISAALRANATVQLTQRNAATLPSFGGMYEIYCEGEPVYWGHADSHSGLSDRLSDHAKRILHRSRLDPSRVHFKSLRVTVSEYMAAEAELFLRPANSDSFKWQKSGFGSNDPGRERETQDVKPEHFDSRHPIDIEVRLPEMMFPRGTSIAEALKRLKKKLPYVLRFEKQNRKPHRDLLESSLPREIEVTNAKGALIAITEAMPAGWQTTVMSGHIIVYKERREYADQKVVFRSRR